jgi:Holliday junction resolvase RusA-like endonuclease
MFRFVLSGNPIPQQQTRFSCRGGFPRAYDPSKKDLEMIRWQIRPFAPSEIILGPVSLTLIFFMPIPKSTSRARRDMMSRRIILPVVRPDEDNLAYIVTNALKDLVYKDDSQVCEKHVYKVYDPMPRTEIIVKAIQTAEKYGLRLPGENDS